ncbi:MAG: polysaccharide biosynthesis protein [Firmicutes bacterium]|nr:polysaccharide biosynthesis protein [Bacillota bacterium]
MKKYMHHLKKQNFLGGALVLAGAGLLVRLLGAGFRIPLANIVGNYGMGLYQMVFPVYALLLVIASSGIPVAISKMVAKERTAKNFQECRKILLNSLIILAVFGLLFATLFTLLADNIASLQGNEGNTKLYLAIAPAVLIVCLMAAFRGYFQGMSNMVPTAVSQLIEQTTKLAIGITLAVILLPRGVEWAVFGAILGTTIAEVFALAFLSITYLAHLRKAKREEKGQERVGTLTVRMVDLRLMWRIFKTALPITFLASVFPLILVFDSLVVVKMLTEAGESTRDATRLFGISTGAVHTLVNMPAVLAIAIGLAIVPMAAKLLKQGKKEEVKQKFFLSIKIIVVIAFFFSLFYLVFAGELINFVYARAFHENPSQIPVAVNLLRMESAMIFLVGLSTIFTSLLQGSDRSYLPLISLIIGGAAKIGFQLALIGTLGIYAVSIGNILCFTIALSLNIFWVMRFMKLKPRVTKQGLSIKARLGLLIGIYIGILFLLKFLLPPGKGWIILAGATAFLGYVIMVLVLRIFPIRIVNFIKKRGKSIQE